MYHQFAGTAAPACAGCGAEETKNVADKKETALEEWSFVFIVEFVVTRDYKTLNHV